MGKGRLEAFSDGVIAIIITIMVLELKVPHGAGVGLYWNKHQSTNYQPSAWLSARSIFAAWRRVERPGEHGRIKHGQRHV